MARVSRDDSARTLDLILRTTVEVMADVGYAGLRVPEVARRMGKTQGTVYGRFADKEALAIAAIRYLRDELILPRVVVAISNAKTSIESLEALSAAIARVAEEHPAGQRMFARLAAETAGQSGTIPGEVRTLFEPFAKTLEDLLVQGIRRGEVDSSVDPHVFARAVLGLPVAFATVSSMFGKPGYRALESALITQLTRGIAKKPTTKSRKRRARR